MRVTQQTRIAGRAREIDAGGVRLAVTEYDGNGPDVLFVHGIGGRGATWWPLLDALAPHVRPITLDLRGHGASAKPERGYLLPDHAADLAAVVDALALDRPRIVGHSLGALVILEWAVAHPNRAAALVLEDPPLRGAPDPDGAFDWWLTLNALPVPEGAALIEQHEPGLPAEFYWAVAESMAGTARAVFLELRDAPQDPATDRLARLGVIASPILLLHGDVGTGGMVYQEDADRCARLLPQARIRRLPGAGHSLHAEHPEAFLRAVVPFLTQ